MSSNATPIGQVCQWVVRRRLVGDDVDRRAAVEQFGEHLGGVAQQADRQRPLGISCFDGELQRLVDGVGAGVEVALFDAALDAAGIAVHTDGDALVHRDGQRLRAAHAAQPGGQRDGAGQRAVEASCARRRRTSRTCPAGCPGFRCRSTSRRSSARTSSTRPPRARGTSPNSPSRQPDSSWRSGPGATTRGCGRPRPACRTAPAWSRRPRGSAAWRRWRRTPPSFGPRGRCRRRPPGPRGARRPRGRGCSSACAGRLPAASPCN